jgi:hypothetical protein
VLSAIQIDIAVVEMSDFDLLFFRSLLLILLLFFFFFYFFLFFFKFLRGEESNAS